MFEERRNGNRKRRTRRERRVMSVRGWCRGKRMLLSLNRTRGVGWRRCWGRRTRRKTGTRRRGRWTRKKKREKREIPNH